MRELKHIHYYERLLEERAFEGGYNFLDAYFSSDTCQQMNRVVENIHELKLIDNPRYTHEIIDAPLKISPHGVKFYCEQVRSHFMKALADLGCDVSDEAIRRAVEEHNRMCAVFEEICKLRKAENPVITPREFHILCLVSYACPTALILPYPEETLEDLRTRQPDEKNNWDKLREACEIWNQQTLCKREKWELNRTALSPHTGSTAWLYRIFEYQCACGSRAALENDYKVNGYLREQVAAKKFPKTVRHRAIVWNTPANMYANFNNWMLDCWGIDSVAEMIDFQGSELIDTSTNETMLCGIAKMAQGSTMRVHTKGGYEVILNDLWDRKNHTFVLSDESVVPVFLYVFIRMAGEYTQKSHSAASCPP